VPTAMTELDRRSEYQQGTHIESQREFVVTGEMAQERAFADS
jgi:hypothetical protein